MQYNGASRLQSQPSEKEVMVSKVQPELLRQCSVNRLLGTNSMALQAATAAHGSEVMHVTVFSLTDYLLFAIKLAG